MNGEKKTNYSLNKLTAFKAKHMRGSEKKIIKSNYLKIGENSLGVIQPNVKNFNVVEWIKENRDFLEKQLFKDGAILFRDFNINSGSKFKNFVLSISSELIEYGERSSPRTQLSSGIYTSTAHPAKQHILLHNEQSYTLNRPMKIWFCCIQPSQEGGRTPLADSRKVFQRLDQQIVEKFSQKKVMYVRNYGNGLGLPWQEVFLTNDKAVVEEHCRKASIEFEWQERNRLKTWQVRPAIRQHPKTGEIVWFNHAVFFHISSLELSVREKMLEAVKQEELPFNTFYGDGSPIEPSVLDAIRKAYHQETLAFYCQIGKQEMC
jgi:alpha-ketoglutarate-dependent taurine dioxygenase